MFDIEYSTNIITSSSSCSRLSLFREVPRNTVVMEGVDGAMHQLRLQIAVIEDVLDGLKAQLANAERNIAPSEPSDGNDASNSHGVSYETSIKQLLPDMKDFVHLDENSLALDAEEYKRYGRQMIMPEVGIEGWSASALV